MTELGFLQALYHQMLESTDPKFKAPLEWSKELYKTIGGANGHAEHQLYMAANTAAEIVSNVSMIEHTGVYIPPAGVSSVLDKDDLVYPVFYYRHSGTDNTVTVDFQLRRAVDNKINMSINHELKPLVIAVDPSLLTKPEDDSKSIILA